MDASPSRPMRAPHVQSLQPNQRPSRIHPKAMPVILTTPEEVDLWLSVDAQKALELQRPLPDDALKIVASGEKEDRAPEAA